MKGRGIRMREHEGYEDPQIHRKKLRKRILLCAGALLLAVVLFFGMILFLQAKVRCSYDELADSIRVSETENGELVIEADLKLYPEDSFESPHWGCPAYRWKTVAVDEENGILYCSVIVYGYVERGEKWFGEPTTKTLYQESLSPHFPDGNTNCKYRCSICEVYYLEWELPGWELLTYGEPALLWSRELPDGVIPLAEPQKYLNPYIPPEGQ